MTQFSRILRGGAALAVVAALGLAPLHAQGGSSSGAGDGASGGSGSGSGGGGLQLASEAIGTLPTWWVEDGATLVHMPVPDQTAYQLDLHLETLVPAELLEQFVAEADGEGYVFLSLPPLQPDMVRVRFYGDVHVELIRPVVEAAGLPLAVRVGSANQGGLGALAIDGALGPVFGLTMPGGAIDVPLGTSPAFDALFEATPVSLYTVAADPTPNGSGWDVGRIDLAVAPERYRFDLRVIDSLLP